MKDKRQLGIWMDHSIAYLIEVTSDGIISKMMESESNHTEIVENLTENGHHLQQRGVNQQKIYYERLSDVIKEYDEVVLFGPGVAKNELINILNENHHFDKIKIEIVQKDKMTENQQVAFVKEYFKLLDVSEVGFNMYKIENV